jgi:hypothetical protein
MNTIDISPTKTIVISMGDLQDPIHGIYVNVPFFRAIVWGNFPEIEA